jgi:hypothetical protein
MQLSVLCAFADSTEEKFMNGKRITIGERIAPNRGMQTTEDTSQAFRFDNMLKHCVQIGFTFFT